MALTLKNIFASWSEWFYLHAIFPAIFDTVFVSVYIPNDTDV